MAIDIIIDNSTAYYIEISEEREDPPLPLTDFTIILIFSATTLEMCFKQRVSVVKLWGDVFIG